MSLKIMKKQIRCECIEDIATVNKIYLNWFKWLVWLVNNPIVNREEQFSTFFII